MSKTRILQVGFGPLGRMMYQLALRRSSEEIVGVVDIDTALEGLDAGEQAGTERSGINISTDLEHLVQTTRPDVAIVTTISDMARIVPIIAQLVEKGLPVVSTCEELVYPWDASPALAKKLDDIARERGVAVLGTGVNPGFLMDSLPAFLSGACSHVERVEVVRYQDARWRRLPFQQKIGAGLSLDKFEQKRQDGSLRHVGLTESMHFIANALGWKLDRLEETLEPVVAGQKVITEHLEIPAGNATGVRQTAGGFIAGEEKIRLIFQASVGEPESFDEVRIAGNPNITSRIQGGVNGDIATCAITLNAIRSVLRAQPGLRTMAEVPMVTCWSAQGRVILRDQ